MSSAAASRGHRDLTIRDTLGSPASTSTTTSIDRKACNPVARWLKLCPNDFAAIVSILFFIWYVLWGIPLTIRLYKYIKSSLGSIRSRPSPNSRPPYAPRSRPRYGKRRGWFVQDVEKGNDGSDSDDSDLEFDGQDPYHSPTRQLHRFLARSTELILPGAIHNPSSKMDETLQVKTRLAHYRFPPSPSAAHSCPVVTACDVFSVCSDTVTCSGSQTSLRTRKSDDVYCSLDDLVFNSYDIERAAYSCSFFPTVHCRELEDMQGQQED